jgi:hypothetical protein
MNRGKTMTATLRLLLAFLLIDSSCAFAADPGNGVPVIESGKMTGALPGKVLRGAGFVP